MSKSKSKSKKALPSSPILSLKRQLIGNHGEILDMVVIPPPAVDSGITDGAVATMNGSSNNGVSDSVPALIDVRVAVASNSSQVRLVEANRNCRSLDGHTDMVLSVAVSPDG